MIKINQFIEQYLLENNQFDVERLSEFREIYADKLIIKDDLLILDKYTSDIEIPPYFEFFDATGIECHYSKIHLDSYMDFHSIGECVQYSLIALKIVKESIKKLTNTKFRIIISISNIEDITIRCHLLRSGENWLSDNIDDYTEGIIVFE